LKSLEYILEAPFVDGKRLDIEVFLVKPIQASTQPVDAHFTPVDNSPSLYNPIRGQQLSRVVPTNDKQEIRVKKNFNCMLVDYILTSPVSNVLYIVIRNYSGTPFTLNGVIKLDFYP